LSLKILSFFILSTIIFSSEHFRKCGTFSNNTSRAFPRPVLSNEGQPYVSPSGYFMIHYNISGNFAPNQTGISENGVPDFVALVGQVADAARALLIEMGYSEPIGDNDGVYDIYLSDEGFILGAVNNYGYNSALDELNSGQDIAGDSYIVISHDFEGFSATDNCANSSGCDPTESIQITVAHEYFHAIQRAYALAPDDPAQNYAGQDPYFFEFSSAWFEEVMFPDVDDYIYWLPIDQNNYIHNPEISISDYWTGSYDVGYSLALFGHYLTKVYDEADELKDGVIMRKIWENFDGSGIGTARDAINTVLLTYGSNFQFAWSDFNARNIFNGEFNDMYNSIYYYEDQILAPPIEIPTEAIIHNNADYNGNNALALTNVSVNLFNMRFREISTADFSYEVGGSESEVISSDNFDDPHYLAGFLAIKSEIGPEYHRIHDAFATYAGNTFASISLDEEDNIISVLSGGSGFDLDMSIVYDDNLNYESGNINFDNTLDILDIYIVISNILGSLILSEYQENLVDVNNDSLINIIDVTTLVYLALEQD